MTCTLGSLSASIFGGSASIWFLQFAAMARRYVYPMWEKVLSLELMRYTKT
jgi:hypothetical protein